MYRENLVEGWVHRHKSIHAGDIEMFKSTDLEIIELAKVNNEVIITHDLDYANLLAFSKEQKPSVIIFRIRNTKADSLFKNIVENWLKIEEPLKKGAIVVIEDASVRIRNLHIS
jgi:predicted nuclease of predicted toxin-antitoxin system